nr:T9SS type A sorting domain-containing protein [Candidatus Neomarinimicrobiota bacterium]
YTNINRINHYDPNTEVLFENLLNSGRGIINYTGHGSATAWLSGAYITNTVVNDLQNDFKLPFIHSVACLNGDFISTTCFAETWLRATNSSTGAPTGAIAMYASTINQSWAPPMRAQDHYIDLLVGFDYSELESIDQKNTIGGLWFNGSCNMVDLYGDDGMMATWTIFGDASLQVRTDTPTPISIVHDGIMYDDENTYYVSTGVEDALVSLSRDGEILASGYTDEFGEVTLQLDEPQIEPGLAILTVSAFNKITVVENVNVVRSIVLTNRRLSDDYNLGGTLTLDNVDTPGDDYPVIYSDDETPLEIEDDQQYIATTTQPLLGANDEYKHIQWNESPTDYLMEVEHIFQPDQTELKAYFETQSSATIEVNHPVELELHDPWYAYINIGEWIQPDEFLPLSELTTDGTYSVFLDQNPYFNEDNPIYSLRGPLSYNTIDETYEFSHWAGSGIIFENTYSNETKVVFLSEGATVEAHYSACYHNTSDWNIVGLPKIVEDSYYQTIFPNSISGTMYTFGAGYQQEANLDIGVGYYLRFYEAGVNCITGIPFTEITLGLSIGWNMISGISETVPVENILDPDNIIIPNTFYEYIDGGLYLTNQMIPGKGYWVRTYHEGEITITNTAQTAGEFVNLMENANWVKFTNDTGKEKKVYFGVDIPEEDQLSYTLPPLPPDEVMVQNFMDTRFTNGKTYTEDVGTIEVRNTDYPLTVEYGILNDNGEWEITSNAPKRINETEEYGDIGRVKLHRTGKIVVGHPIKSFTIRKTNTNNLPTEFALRQNYPNPFNPVTTIGYDIAESGNVRISVYALTGQRIKTLVSGYKEPGRYEATWNSTDSNGNLMPTGVYFYAIETSTYTATKKLVLIK